MRKFIAVHAIAIGICGAVAVPAVAQQAPAPTPTPTPTPAPSSVETVYDSSRDARFQNNTAFEREFDLRRLFTGQDNGVKAYKDAMGIAKCLYKAADGDVSPLVGGPLSDDPEYTNMKSAMRRPNFCMRRQQPAADLLIGASLAEMSVLAREDDLPPRALSLDMDRAEAFYTPSDGTSTLDHVGRCTAVFSPGLSMNVMKTKVGSDAEKSALDTVYAATPECGVSSTPDSIPVVMQRAAIAFGLEAWLRGSNS